MDMKKVFNPDWLNDEPQRETIKYKNIQLLNGESLKVQLKILNWRKGVYYDYSPGQWTYFNTGQVHFVPRGLNSIELKFYLFNKNKEQISDFNWNGFYFDIFSKEKKTFFQKEVRDILKTTILLCLNKDLSLLTGNFEEFNIINKITQNKDNFYYGDNQNYEIDKLINTFYLQYSGLVLEANENLENINLNLSMIQDSKVLSGDIEQRLKQNSYDPENLILTNGAFANVWGGIE